MPQRFLARGVSHEVYVNFVDHYYPSNQVTRRPDQYADVNRRVSAEEMREARRIADPGASGGSTSAGGGQSQQTGGRANRAWYAEAMPAAALAEPIPLETNPDGVIRVGGTRVQLETVIETFNAGATPEEIAQDFPVLHLDDVYAVITYYLRHRAEVDAYLRRRRQEADRIRRKIEARFPQTGLRERLQARLDR